jgi:CMP-N-acetylneuraminic acid synthetase
MGVFCFPPKTKRSHLLRSITVPTLFKDQRNSRWMIVQVRMPSSMRSGSIVADGGSIKQFCLLQPTSPLRTAQHIDDAIDLYHQANDRPLISVTSAPSNINKLLEGSAHGIRPVFGQVEFGARPSSVAPFRYVPNGAIYIVSIAHFFETGSLYDSMMTPFIMHRTCSIDIDYPEDIRMAEALIEAAWGL